MFLVTYRWQAIIACVALFGVGFGTVVALSMSRSPNRLLAGVVLEPRVAEFVRDPLEHEKVLMHLQLRNDTKQDVSVIAVETSCNCMSIVTRDEQPFDQPIVVPAEALLPLRVELNTSDRYGPQEYLVLVRARAGARTVDRISRIRMNIRSSLRASPSTVIFRDVAPGAVIEQSVELLDGYADPGIEISDVSSSAPDVLSATLVPPPQKEEEDGSEPSTEPLKVRHLLRLRYGTKASETSNGVSSYDVTVTPATEPARPIRIPVLVYWRKPQFEVVPESLVLPWPQSKGTQHRQVRIIQRGKTAGPVSVLHSPPYAKVQIRTHQRSESAVVSDCEISLELSGEVAPSDGAIRFGTAGSSEVMGQLNVCFLTL